MASEGVRELRSDGSTWRIGHQAVAMRRESDVGGPSGRQDLSSLTARTPPEGRCLPPRARCRLGRIGGEGEGLSRTGFEHSNAR
jgi:hypothetical protein